MSERWDRGNCDQRCAIGPKANRWKVPGRPDQGFLAVGRDHGECHRGHRGVVAAREVENVEDLVDRPPRLDLSGSEGLESRYGGGGVDAVAAHIAHDEDDGGRRLDHVEPIAADVDTDVTGEIATGDLEAIGRGVDPGSIASAGEGRCVADAGTRQDR